LARVITQSKEKIQRFVLYKVKKKYSAKQRKNTALCFVKYSALFCILGRTLGLGNKTKQ